MRLSCHEELTTRKGTNRSDKRCEFWFNFWIIFPAVLIFIFIFGAAIILSILENKVIAMGRAGFIRNAAFRIGLGGLAAVIAGFCMKGILKRRKSVKAVLGHVFGIILCLLLAFFLIRPVVLDIPYLDHPEITYLASLEFDDDHTGDGPARYYLSGVGSGGSTHRFSLNEEIYKAGRELWFEDFDLRAKIAYLPHTDIVMSLQYLSPPDK